MKKKHDLDSLNVDSKKEKKYKIIRTIIQIVILIIFVGAMVFATIKLFPFFLKLKDEEYRLNIADKLKSKGFISFFIIILMQVIQTVFMIIPGGPITILAGMMFNPFLAILTCLIGQTLGGILVYFLVKIFGYGFLALFVDPKKIKESKLVKNPNKASVLMFGYLLIPMLPKDIIAFIAPFTNIGIKRFIFISFFARIPMTVASVLLGGSLLSGNLALGIIVGCVCLILAVLCFIFNNKIVLFLDNIKIKKENKNEE